MALALLISNGFLSAGLGQTGVFYITEWGKYIVFSEGNGAENGRSAGPVIGGVYSYK